MQRTSKLSFTFLAFAFSVQAMAHEFSFPFENIEEIAQDLNFSSVYAEATMSRSSRKVKVAIFDVGFRGVEKEIGKSLPADTQLFRMPENGGEDPHGLGMAMLVTAMMTENGKRPELAPELYLFNTKGYGNLQRATADVVELGVDVVLYAQVWELGNNWDGRGPINALISKATSNGVLFINAAGNFALTTYNGRVETNDRAWVQLPDKHNALEIECHQSEALPEGKCPVKIVLSWNEFNDHLTLGTEKDLDLFLSEEVEGELLPLPVQSSQQVQILDVQNNEAGKTPLPYEQIETTLRPGKYFITILDRSRNFGRQSKFRVVVSGPEITMRSYDQEENLLNPADHPEVIAVGASDSPRSSLSLSLRRPDIWAPSSVRISQNNPFGSSQGAQEIWAMDTSTASAIYAAGVALLKMARPNLNRDQVLELTLGERLGQGRTRIAQRTGRVGPGRGAHEKVELRLEPYGGAQDYEALPLSQLRLPLHPYLEGVLRAGGLVVRTNEGIKIMMTQDPYRLFGERRRGRSERVLVHSRGFTLVPREYRPTAQGGFYDLGLMGKQRGELAVEVVQLPRDQFLLVPQADNERRPLPRLPAWARGFRMP